jgi:hypothetical protein
MKSWTMWRVGCRKSIDVAVLSLTLTYHVRQAEVLPELPKKKEDKQLEDEE